MSNISQNNNFLVREVTLCK